MHRWEALPDNFSQRGEIRLYTIHLLRPANTKTVTGDNFIKNQEYIVCPGDLPDIY